MHNLSVIIITYNESSNIARCIQSVKSLAAEVIVVDSNSTDDTEAIARSLGAKVLQRAFTGYADQKNYATAMAANDWILSLDADEELTQALSQSIRSVLASPVHSIYKMPRLTNYCGQWIKHAGWYPDWQMRLYNRTSGSWANKKVHEHWQSADGNASMGILKGDLLHYSFTSIAQHIQKIDRYSELAARDAFEKGRRASLFKVLFSPFWNFFSSYIIKLGFLDGYYGYVVCKLSAYGTFQKYARTRQLFSDAR